MRRCVRCDVLVSMDDMTHMEGVIWLHDDLDLCDSLKNFVATGLVNN